jgi:hypothetical protein
LAAGAFLPRLLAAEIWPNVTDKKTFFLKENDLEKRWYVIFMQLILACKNARKKPKSQLNFVTPTKILKSQISGIWLQKSQSGNPGAKIKRLRVGLVGGGEGGVAYMPYYRCSTGAPQSRGRNATLGSCKELITSIRKESRLSFRMIVASHTIHTHTRLIKSVDFY